MTLHISHSDIDNVQTTLGQALDMGEFGEVAEPVRAGMRARAIADTCERLGLPAVLIDRHGRVLHVGSAAERCLNAELRVSNEHLVAGDAARNDAISRAIDSALSDIDTPDSPEPDESLPLVGLRYRDSSPYQMLAGVLLLTSATDARVMVLRPLLNT